MDKTKLSFFILIIFLFIFRIWQTTGCKQFSSFIFSPLSIKIEVESQRSFDQNTNRYLSRFFHNKLQAGIFEIGNLYMFIFRPKFLLEVFGPIGLALFILALFRAYVKKNVFILGHLALTLIILLVTIFISNPKASFYLIAMALFTFSLNGISGFWQKEFTYKILFLLLVIVTFLYFIFSWQLLTFCNEIFFN